MNSYNFNRHIIRKYDIRGSINETLFEQDAYYLGRAFAGFMHQNNVTGEVCVGRDGRLSSPTLADALIQGLIDSGQDVINIGMVATPMLYYAAYTKSKSQTGVMVTGSHNPINHNGFKMMMRGRPVFDTQIVEIADIAKSGHFLSGNGVLQDIDITQPYLEKLQRNNKVFKFQPRVVWDTGNGAAGCVVSQLIARLPGDHILINGEVDGNFPSGSPDPTIASNLRGLIAAIKTTESDMGIAFDGDGDRIVAIDNCGNIIRGEQLLLIFAEDLLLRHRGSKIIADIKTSNNIFKQIKKAGGLPIMWKTGHSFIKNKMKDENALLAGEMSGHIFFAEDYYGFDDAIYAACKLISIISAKEKSLFELVSQYSKSVSTPELRVPCDEAKKFNIIQDLANYLKKRQIKFNDLDGIRVDDAESWWLVRASNTENCLVIRAEAKDKIKLSAIILLLKNIMQELDIDICFK